MTTQEKINSLALAALDKDCDDSPPVAPPGARPSSMGQPAYPQSPAAGAFASSPVMASSSPAPGSALAQPSAGASQKTLEIDSELREIMEVREVKLRKKRVRMGRAVTLIFLAMIGSAAGWATLTTSGQHKMSALGTALRESKGDFTNLTGILSTYNKQLDKIAVQSARVDAATRALGVDPDKEQGKDGLDLNAEMQKMAGGAGSGPTSLERDEKLKEKFGAVSKLLGGSDASKPKPESDVKF